MKISFDFDGTLSTSTIQKLAQRHIQYGDEVHITTSRFHESATKKFFGRLYNNSKLYAIADKLGIPKDNIHFTHFQPKVNFLKTFDVHYDDDPFEIDDITRSEISCIGLLVNFQYSNYIAG